MGNHSKPGNPKTTDNSDYKPKHSGGWDGRDWAEYSNATEDTQVVPVVIKKGKK